MVTNSGTEVTTEVLTPEGEALKRWFVLPILCVLFYLITAFVLLGPFGGAGHGWGIGVFLDISLPASLIAAALDEIYPQHGLAVWLSLAGGALQYFLLGMIVQWVVTSLVRRLRGTREKRGDAD